ncbi:hypothetical protein [Actinomyces minihominis]|nr:hypothetical protein [Actinomyces minihominis]
MSHAVEITLNPHKHRFEAHLNGELVGKLVYKEDDDVMSGL